MLLNVIVIVKSSLKTGRTAKVLLFSDDLSLPYDKLANYYQLRFQIEFNFRDAKQYWGLDDFMNTIVHHLSLMVRKRKFRSLFILIKYFGNC
jgi:hypothetical protein